MPWVLRGLRGGVVTTRWPDRPDAYTDAVRSVAIALPAAPATDVATARQVARLCPTAAIDSAEGRLQIDQGRCIGCGRCVEAMPALFGWRPGSDAAGLQRDALFVAVDGSDQSGQLAQLRRELRARTRAFGRSVHIRHVDAGSDGTEEWEIAALLNPVYDVHRLGLFFTASPRHADLLLVTGIGATGMRAPLQRTLEAMPRPVAVLAVGTDACSGGLLADSYAGSAGVGDLLKVDVWVPGSPPTPFAILYGILLALDRAPVDLMAGQS